MASKLFFHELISHLAKSSAMATAGTLKPANTELRRFLREDLSQPAGEDGSFLAEPVLEAIFEWEKHDRRFASLDYLESRLVHAMDQPPEHLKRYRFGADWYPYRHQHAAWSALCAAEPRSVVVSTGTSSGKTECFLVPILNDLARASAKNGRDLEGVRALFLYPLNALINSQKERLEAWTAGLPGVRFGLYNGATPERETAHTRRASESQALDRHTLRNSPPPILVTNATMLEYMLVRQLDAPLIERSRGHLRWVVLDEAHTYLGSAAAELSLLLRRVMNAFEVAPDDVRFVATSATMGEAEDADRLRRFLADVAGTSPDRVDLVTGRRAVPPLDGKATTRLPDLDTLSNCSPDELFAKLGASAAVREIRERLGRSPTLLSDVTRSLLAAHDGSGADTRATALRYLDFCANARRGDAILLPLRAHLFHRTLAGLWSCINPACAGKLTHPGKEWPHGQVFANRRTACDHCESLVYPVVLCNCCGEAYLEAIDHRGLTLPADLTYDDDSGLQPERDEPDDDTSEEESEANPTKLHLTTGRRGPFLSAPFLLDAKTGAVGSGLEGSVSVSRLVETESGQRCDRCKEAFAHPERFRSMMLGRPFFQLATTRELLAFLPAPSPEGRSEAPSTAESPFLGGRQLITFSDSRQGTALSAARLQLDAERNFARSAILHLCTPDVSDRDERKKRREALQGQHDKLVSLLAAGPDPVIEQMLSECTAQIAALRATSSPTKSWRELVSDLSSIQGTRGLYAHLSERDARPPELRDLARVLLAREFVTRPRRPRTIETMGLARLRYVALDGAKSPRGWCSLGGDDQEWQDFLHLCVDFIVRRRSCVGIDETESRWLGRKFRTRHLLGPRAGAETNRWQVEWPLVRTAIAMPAPAAMAFVAFSLSPESPGDRELVSSILCDAWEVINSRLLTGTDQGRMLDMWHDSNDRLAVELVQTAWLCPVTDTLLPVTLRGISPYAAPLCLRNGADSWPRCQELPVPSVPFRLGNTRDGVPADESEIRSALSADPAVAALKQAGQWDNLSERIFAYSSYFSAAEHSAQQPQRRLQRIEQSFRERRTNVLACSTTMEMGVDIGGLQAVLMNNAPPGPANFLQRAGRAGRRSESHAVSLTLCGSTPHGMAVFKNPMWPFTTPTVPPEVSLRSAPIVERHVAAALLSAFLRRFSESEAMGLRCQWFFGQVSPAPADKFVDWLDTNRHEESDERTRIQEGLARLLRGSVLASQSLDRTISNAQHRLKQVSETWRRERLCIVAQFPNGEAPAADATVSEPYVKALQLQLKRVDDEYLLRYLATAGFLPSYGFPLGVVPFINTTAESIARRKERSQTDSPSDGPRTSRADFPSRHISMAIREYAPGNTVVLDGVSYRSEGLTLRWQLPPAGEVNPTEVQDLAQVVECHKCGMLEKSRGHLSKCPHCGSDTDSHAFITPGGFAVDIRAKPTNDIENRAYVPVRQPLISARGELVPVADDHLRYRYDPRGSIFHWSDGAHERGYALCLRCGRSESETETTMAAATGTKNAPLLDHRPLRRSSKDERKDGLCDAGQFAIRRGLWLGGFDHTDVMELELTDPVTGATMANKTQATTLAVALREAAAQELGVDARELGWSVKEAAPDGEPTRYTIFLYDTADGGAGYVGTLPDRLQATFKQARRLLNCKEHCDGACHSCVLTWDSQHHVRHLNRHAALEFLTERWLDGLSFSGGHHPPGKHSCTPELLPLTARLERELARPDTSTCRLHLSRDYRTWQLTEWRLLAHLERASEEVGCRVELVVDPIAQQEMDWTFSRELHAVCESRRIHLVDGRGTPDTWAVELERANGEVVRWYGEGISLAPGSQWGTSVRVIGRATAEDTDPLNPLPEVDNKSLLREPPGKSVPIDLGQKLGVEARKLGGVFWNLVEEQAGTHLGNRELREVQYSDRYVRSPSAAAAVASVINEALTRFGQGAQPDVTVVTAEPNTSNNYANAVFHDWPRAAQQKAVLSQLISSPGRTSVDVRSTRDLPHARLLVLRWSNSTQTEIHLDQGFGFLHMQGRPAFDFGAPVTEQAKRLRKKDIRFRVPEPSRMYVSSR